MRRKAKGQEGFTLIEVLVAFAILAVSLGVLAHILSSGLRGGQVADAYSTATMLAQSKLATIGTQESLVAGETAGSFDDQYRWRVDVRPHVEDQTSQFEPLIDAYEVVVTVAWDGSSGPRSVSLATLRLSPRL